jgi:glycosyltransferase involved in cell wall biosynthesis
MAIYVGHITLGDDLDLALHAFAQTIRHLPDAKLVIVGTGSGLDSLRSLASDLSLGESVIFTGWIDHAHIPAYLSTANVAIYPYRDTLINRAKCSIKILEYMTTGKAIVTHRVGQNIEYLEHNRSGILVEPGNIEEFAKGLVVTLSNPTLAAELGIEAQHRITQRFTWEKRIATIEHAYKSAISAKSGKGTHHPSRYLAQS